MQHAISSLLFGTEIRMSTLSIHMMHILRHTCISQKNVSNSIIYIVHTIHNNFLKLK